MRVELLLARERGAAGVAASLADTALRWFPEEQGWYAARGCAIFIGSTSVAPATKEGEPKCN